MDFTGWRHLAPAGNEIKLAHQGPDNYDAMWTLLVHSVSYNNEMRAKMHELVVDKVKWSKCRPWQLDDGSRQCTQLGDLLLTG